MKYPSVYLMGPKASGEVLSVAYAGAGQHPGRRGQDGPLRSRDHVEPSFRSRFAKDGGTTTYRGLVEVEEGADGREVHRSL
jgi:Fe-S cluster assembly protein SufB